MALDRAASAWNAWRSPPSPLRDRAGRPRSTRWPARNTTTRSAMASTAGSCAATSTVRPTAVVAIASITSRLDALSRAAVGSSSRSTGASASRTRASAMRCRCPPDSRLPASPIGVSYPSGNAERELVDQRPLAGGEHRSAAWSVGAEGDVVGDRAVEHPRRLREVGDGAAQAGTRATTHVDPVQLDRAAVDVAQPGHQRQQGRLARAARAGDAHDLAGGHDEVGAVELRRPSRGGRRRRRATTADVARPALTWRRAGRPTRQGLRAPHAGARHWRSPSRGWWTAAPVSEPAGTGRPRRPAPRAASRWTSSRPAPAALRSPGRARSRRRAPRRPPGSSAPPPRPQRCRRPGWRRCAHRSAGGPIAHVRAP